MTEFNPGQIRIPESPAYTWLKSARIKLFEGQVHSMGGGLPRYFTKEELDSMDPATYRLVHSPEDIKNLEQLNLDEWFHMSDDEIDSEAYMELVVGAEEAFGITIPEDEWMPLDSPYSKFLALIQSKLTEQAVVIAVAE